MLAVSKSPEVTSCVSVTRAAHAVERANASEACALGDLYAQWLGLRSAVAEADQRTVHAHERAVQAAAAVAPEIVWTHQDFTMFGGVADWVGRPVNFQMLDWLDKWMESQSAKKADIDVILRARHIIDAEMKFRTAVAQMSVTFDVDALEQAEDDLWNKIAVVENDITRLPAKNFADLKLKALVALKQFPADEDVDQDWPDACALSVLRDVLELTQ